MQEGIWLSGYTMHEMVLQSKGGNQGFTNQQQTFQVLFRCLTNHISHEILFCYIKQTNSYKLYPKKTIHFEIFKHIKYKYILLVNSTEVKKVHVFKQCQNFEICTFLKSINLKLAQILLSLGM